MDMIPKDSCRVAVIGAGSWGTAFANHLALQGISTVLMTRRNKQVEALHKSHRNPDYLSFIELAQDLQYDSYLTADMQHFQLIALAIPSKSYSEVLSRIVSRLPAKVGILILSKGMEPESNMRLSQVVGKAFACINPSVAVLSGPNQAEEIALGQPTAAVIASNDKDYACFLQQLLTGDSFRTYVNSDMLGIELAAALKNVIALATGMSDGLGYGDNARAALVTRGLAEMTRLGVAMGANTQTFFGLAGLGDLVCTCTSRHSRNRMAGDLIAQGYAPSEVEDKMGMIAEGLMSAPIILKIAKEISVDLPITENVVAVLCEGKDVQDCVRDLMNRELKGEIN